MLPLLAKNRNIRRPYVSVKRPYDPVFNPETEIFLAEKIAVSSYDKILVSVVIDFLIPYSIVTV